MKLFKKLLLTIAFVAGVTFAANAQSGWNTARYYAYSGGANVSCGYTYTVQKTDGFGNYWVEGWQNCRKMVWHKEYRSGYIYYWGNGGWYSEWKEGYSWYYNWYDYATRVY